MKIIGKSGLTQRSALRNDHVIVMEKDEQVPCPSCNSPLTFVDETNEKPFLNCKFCKKRYPIVYQSLMEEAVKAILRGVNKISTKGNCSLDANLNLLKEYVVAVLENDEAKIEELYSKI